MARWNEYAGGYSDMVAQRGFGVTSDQLTAAQTALGRAEDEWLELEALRETIEG
jgi:hypothetical protein